MLQSAFPPLPHGLVYSRWLSPQRQLNFFHPAAETREFKLPRAPREAEMKQRGKTSCSFTHKSSFETFSGKSVFLRAIERHLGECVFRVGRFCVCTTCSWRGSLVFFTLRRKAAREKIMQIVFQLLPGSMALRATPSAHLQI
jgi:hypothetical protein